MRPSIYNKRLRSLAFLFILFLLIIIVRLFYLQIYDASRLALKANEQRKRDVRLVAKRGAVYDRDGKVLAVSVKKQTVFATPYLIANPKETASKISRILKLKRSDVYEKLTSDKGFVYIKRKIDKKQADQIKSLGIEGVSLCDEYKRYYPSGSIACQVLGFVGVDNNGLSGIEKQFDKRLSGKLGRIIYQQDAMGRQIPGTTALYQKPVSGKSLQLSLDTEIQYKVESELQKAVKDWGAKAGSALVMDPRNGEILAMASMPKFDLNNFNKASPEQMKNRSLVEVFEPGSTMKPMLVAAALEEKIFKPESMFFLPPTINVFGKVIGEAHDRPTVNYSLTDIIAHSSNVGMSKVGLALKKQRVVKYLKRFEFDQKAGIDFPGEVTGVVPSLNQFYGPTVATVCFGQGVSTTALQLARAYASFANGGKLVKPKFEFKEVQKEKKKRVISKETAWEITLMLEKVIKEGTGETAKVPGYLVAGKTGTAQKPIKGIGYSGGKFIGTFVGYAPAENARLLVLVSVDEPSKAIYGGVVAAPAFSAIMEYSLQHLQINPR